MISVFRHHIAVSKLLEVLADAALCFFAVLLALKLQGHPNEEVLPAVTAIKIAGLFTLLMVCIYVALGIYWRHETQHISTRMARGVLALVIGLPIAYLQLHNLPYGPSPFLTLGYLLVLLLGGLVILRQTQAWLLRKGVGARKVLIVGADEEAKRVAADLETFYSPAFKLVGFYQAEPEMSRVDLKATGIFPRSRSVEQIVREQGVDEIIVAAREQRGGALPLRDLISCRTAGVRVLDLAGFYERTHGRVPIESLRASWLIYGKGFVQDTMRTIIKRLTSVLGALVLLALTWPVMLATALLIKLESRGPVIYRQERVGLRGRTFMCLKFRSMRTDAEKDGRAVWAQKNDPRVTRMGGFIRKTRIDELPQLFNVLCGDMSLVGPRPERPAFVEQLKEEIPFYDVRHSVKPGLTGWAQVRYAYGASSEDARRKLEYDLYYVKNHSLFLDLLIILYTVRIVLFREGSR